MNDRISSTSTTEDSLSPELHRALCCLGRQNVPKHFEQRAIRAFDDARRLRHRRRLHIVVTLGVALCSAILWITVLSLPSVVLFLTDASFALVNVVRAVALVANLAPEFWLLVLVFLVYVTAFFWALAARMGTFAVILKKWSVS